MNLKSLKTTLALSMAALFLASCSTAPSSTTAGGTSSTGAASTTTATSTTAAVTTTPSENGSTVNAEQVAAALKDGSAIIVDARSNDAYAGWAAGSNKMGGHIKVPLTSLQTGSQRHSMTRIISMA